MNHNKVSSTRFFGRSPLLLLLLFGLAFSLLQINHTFAQTGAPPPPGEPVISPPPGTTVVEPTFPAVPPAGIEPVTGNGALAVIPESDDGGVGLVNVTLEDETQATLLVPTSQTDDLVVRIQALDNASPPAPLPEEVDKIIQLFEIDLFSASTAEEITSHDPPLILGISLPAGVDPTELVLLHYDSSDEEYDTWVVTVDPVTGLLLVEITETSPFVLATGKIEGASVPENTVIPAGLPTTGGQASTTNFLWPILALVGFGLVGIWRWRDITVA